MFPSVFRWKVAEHNYEDLTCSDLREIGSFKCENVLLLTASEITARSSCWSEIMVLEISLAVMVSGNVNRFQFPNKRPEGEARLTNNRCQIGVLLLCSSKRKNKNFHSSVENPLFFSTLNSC